MSITRYRPVRFQPVPYSAVRPDPFLGLLDGLLSAPASRPSQPAVRVERNDAGVAVHADLPGVRREDVEVSATADARGARVSLSAVRHLDGAEQRFRWSAHLDDVDPDSVTASLADGVLTVSAATRPGPVARTVEVTVADPSEPAALPADTPSDEVGSQGAEPTVTAEDTSEEV